MMEETRRVVSGHLLDETVTLSLTEISCACRVGESEIIDLVEEGIIEPAAPAPDLNFPATELRRARRAIRLQRDLDINLAGVALVIDLLEEVEDLRARLR
jgi:chaperone modulatory protein CbpM